MNKSYITSLLGKNHRQLDLYEIAEIQEAVGLEWVAKQQEADFYEEHYEIKWAELRLKIRKSVADSGCKVTEALIEDETHVLEEWKDFIDTYLITKRTANEFKQKVKKWENYYTAKMSLEATQRRITI